MACDESRSRGSASACTRRENKVHWSLKKNIANNIHPSAQCHRSQLPLSRLHLYIFTHNQFELPGISISLPQNVGISAFAIQSIERNVRLHFCGFYETWRNLPPKLSCITSISSNRRHAAHDFHTVCSSTCRSCQYNIPASQNCIVSASSTYNL